MPVKIIGKLNQGYIVYVTNKDAMLTLEAMGVKFEDTHNLRSLDQQTKKFSGLNLKAKNNSKKKVDESYKKTREYSFCVNFFNYVIRTSPQKIKQEKLAAYIVAEERGDKFTPVQQRSYDLLKNKRNEILDDWYKAILKLQQLGETFEEIKSVIDWGVRNINPDYKTGKSKWQGWHFYLHSMPSLVKVNEGRMKYFKIKDGYLHSLSNEGTPPSIGNEELKENEEY